MLTSNRGAEEREQTREILSTSEFSKPGGGELEYRVMFV